MKRLIIAAILAMFAFPASAVEFYGENWTAVCAASANELRDTLSGDYGEHMARSATDDQVSFEFWVNKEEKTWTLMFARPDGSACIVAAGTAEWVENKGI